MCVCACLRACRLGAHRTVWHLPRWVSRWVSMGNSARTTARAFSQPLPSLHARQPLQSPCPVTFQQHGPWPLSRAWRDASLTPPPGVPLQAEFRLWLNPPSASGCIVLCQPSLLWASHCRAQGLAVEAALSGSIAASAAFKLKQGSPGPRP